MCSTHLAFSSNILNPSYNYQWNFGDGNTSAAINPSHNFNNPGAYPIELIVSNNTGCADTTATQVNAYESPAANFFLSTNSDVYYADISHMFFSNQSSGATQYLWEFGNGDTSTAFEPNYDYIHPGVYNVTLSVVNQYGCMDRTTAPFEVKVPEDLFVPSAFTPNGDDSNDYFDVKSQNITDLNIRIFNRWGEEIFHSSDKDFKWDGTYQGRLVQQDVYVYLIDATGYHGKHFNLAGSVTVLK
jgi:gliding motility-associated-like protein